MSAFNFDEALKGLREGKNLTGQNGILTPLIKQLTEAALQDKLKLTIILNNQKLIRIVKMATLRKTYKQQQVALNLRRLATEMARLSLSSLKNTKPS